jgi:hypothetical protein
MGRRQVRRTFLLMLVLVAFAGPAGAQYRDAVETQIADLEQMRDKFIALAEAFPAETYAWRPMEGVRSVHDVMALMAAECVLFPTMWGFDSHEHLGQSIAYARSNNIVPPWSRRDEQ